MSNTMNRYGIWCNVCGERLMSDSDPRFNDIIDPDDIICTSCEDLDDMEDLVDEYFDMDEDY